MNIRQAKKLSRPHRLKTKVCDNTFNQAFYIALRHWRRGYEAKNLTRYKRTCEFLEWARS